MAQEYYFFDSTKDDIRRFQARHLAEVIDTILQTGLLHKDGTPTIRVTANTKDMKVRVTPGKAVIKGHLYRNTEAMVLDIPKTNTVKRVVLRLDNNIDNRFIKVFVTEGDKNTPKPLRRDNDVYELALCHIKYDASKGYLEQSDITDTRFDENLCGLAHSLITVPTSEYQKEWNKFVQRYEKWFQQHQNSSYATVDYVKKNDDELRRIIAEMQLGDGGIVEGDTFGTDFEKFQNIKLLRGAVAIKSLDKKSCVVSRGLGGVSTGDLLTIYDDTNKEIVKAARVRGSNIYFESELTKTFKKGAFIAHSQGVAKSGENSYVFGGWGDVLELQDYAADFSISGVNGAKDIHKVDACIEGNTLYLSYKTVPSYETEECGIIIFDLTKKTILEHLKVSDQKKNHAGVVSNGKDMTAVFYRVQGSNDYNVKCYENGNLLHEKKLSELGNRNIYEVKVVKSMDDRLRLIVVEEGSYTRTLVQVTSSDTFAIVDNAPGVNCYIGNNLFAIVGSVRNSAIPIYELVGDSLINRTSLTLKPNSYAIYTSELIFSKTNGWCVVAKGHGDNKKATDFHYKKVTDISLGDYNMEKLEYGISLDEGAIISATGDKNYPLVCYDKTNNKVGLIDADFGYTLQSSDKIEFYKDGTVVLLPRNNFVPNGEVADALPLIKATYSSNVIDLKFVTNGIIGDGTELLENDVRFNLKRKTKRVAVSLVTDGKIKIKGYLGKVPLAVTVNKNTVQLTGLASEESDTLTITMQRDDINDKVALKRLAGGIDA